MPLSEKRQRFIDEYLIDMNASQAAIRAGYSCHRANQRGYFLVTNGDIKKEIDRKMAEKAQKLDISREKILSMLMEEAQNPDNQSNVRVAALSHLGRFTLGELSRSEVNGAIAFKWEDDSDTAGVGMVDADINENKLIESNS
tara:strand:+ start:630 stop:1055 length:426 start_codon:yes stop_codon:yes gene_type:complete